MIQRFILVFTLLFILAIPVIAGEKVPVTITPDQLISTDYDEIEIGDELNFKVVRDVYSGDNLLIKKGAPVLALVDYVSENGFAADSAYVQIKKFMIQDVKNNWITVYYPLKITGLECRNPKANMFYKGFHSVAFIIRGDEVNLKPEQRKFNIFIEY